MSWIIVPKVSIDIYRKKKIRWFYGIDPMELSNGDFVLPDKVTVDIKRLAKDSFYDIELGKLSTQETVIFK
jgi:hypothetical protein